MAVASVYPQIADVLRERITPQGYRRRNGEKITYTERLPPQTELCAEFGPEFGEDGNPVNHHTVGKALGLLVEEGLLTVRDRRGYYVRRVPRLRFNLTRGSRPDYLDSVPVDTWESDVEREGHSHRQAITPAKVLASDRLDDHYTVGDLLGLEPDELVVARLRLRYIGADLKAPANQPESVHNTYYPMYAAQGTELERPDSVNTTRILAARGYAPVRFTFEIGARMPRKEEMERLRLPKATALLERFVVAYNEQGRPVYLQHTLAAGNNTRILLEINNAGER